MSNWFVIDQFNGDSDFFDTLEEAKKFAKERIGDGSDGWEQELLDGAIKMGQVLYVSSETNKKENINEDGETINSDWDFICDCEMVENDSEFHQLKELLVKKDEIIKELWKLRQLTQYCWEKEVEIIEKKIEELENEQ